ncbi:MAG TPA: sigma-70 family RNA polymerase sigma factor [Gemmataceae bacterium]|nr:sigma-70 family RNA polymerase sigma factor [Gemmataceae bacterium]
MPADPIDDVLGQIARGDIEVARVLFAAYTPYLRALVRRQQADRLRAKFDSDDVVQSVWVQVLQKLGRDGWLVNDEPRLRGLLATIARRRLLTRARAHDRDPEESETSDPATDRNPRPSEVAQAGDLWSHLLHLCPPQHREVLVLKREGLPLAEIAARTGLHEGSVRRILRQLARDLALRQEPLPVEAEAEPTR